MSILKRSVLYVRPKQRKDQMNQIRFTGWALTNTTLGTMVEMFDINNREVPGAGMVDYDPSDMMSRIDDLQNVPEGYEYKILSGGSDNPPIHGGDLYPRVLIKTGNYN